MLRRRLVLGVTAHVLSSLAQPAGTSCASGNGNLGARAQPGVHITVTRGSCVWRWCARPTCRR